MKQKRKLIDCACGHQMQCTDVKCTLELHPCPKCGFQAPIVGTDEIDVEAVKSALEALESALDRALNQDN